MAIDEPAHVSLVAGQMRAAACALCTAATASLTTVVVVQHPHGGSVELAACDWCVQAIRRLSAATGGRAVFALSETAGLPPSAGPPMAPLSARPTSPTVLIRELVQHIQGAEAAPHVIRIYGGERADGTWEGWLEFEAVGEAGVLRTARETTQSSREGLVYWANGLEPAYFDGAFARAQRP